MKLRHLLNLFRQKAVRVQRESLAGLRARDATKLLPVVHEGSSLKEVLQRMLEGRSTILPVVSDTVPCGLISVDALRQASPAEWGQLRLEKFAHACDAPADSNEPLEDTYIKLLLIPLEAIPVADGGRIVGIIRLCELDEIIELRTLLRREPPSAALRPLNSARG